MSGFLSLLPLDGLATLLGGILAAIVAGAALYWRGRSTGRSGAETKAKEAENEAYRETRTRIDNAGGGDADLDATRDRMRARGNQ